MGLLDDLLEFGCGFDWVSPLWATVQDVARGPSHTFAYVPTVTGRDIQKALARAGVQSWGWFHVAFTDDSVFSVRKADAVRTQQLLDQLGVPVTGGAVATVTRVTVGDQGQQQRPPVSTGTDRGLFGLFDLFGK